MMMVPGLEYGRIVIINYAKTGLPEYLRLRSLSSWWYTNQAVASGNT